MASCRWFGMALVRWQARSLGPVGRSHRALRRTGPAKSKPIQCASMDTLLKPLALLPWIDWLALVL